MVYRRTSSSRL